MVELLAKWLNEDVGLSKVSKHPITTISCTQTFNLSLKCLPGVSKFKISILYPNLYDLESNQL